MSLAHFAPSKGGQNGRKRYTPDADYPCCAKPRWPWRRASPLVKLVARSAYRSRVTIAGASIEYGGLRTDQAKRLKDLEKENGRLRKAISDLTLDKLILKEALEGNC